LSNQTSLSLLTFSPASSRASTTCVFFIPCHRFFTSVRFHCQNTSPQRFLTPTPLFLSVCMGSARMPSHFRHHRQHVQRQRLLLLRSLAPILQPCSCFLSFRRQIPCKTS
jgi:hypothetical protein